MSTEVQPFAAPLPAPADAVPPPLLGDRSLFAGLQWPVYANFASITPPSVPVQQAMARQVRDMAQRGASAFGEWLGQRGQLRADLAQLLGCAPEDLALVQSTTAGIAAVALAIDWRPRDKILCFLGEFPANVTPWQQIALRFGAVCQLMPLPAPQAAVAPWLERVEAELRKGVRLLAISAVQFQTGWRAPLGELAALCHRYGAEICVDAVQALGAVPLDVRALQIDYLSAGSHKWLMGPEGAGVLYLAPQRRPQLLRTQAGWLSHEDPVSFLLQGKGLLRYDRPIRERSDWLEGGNLAAASCAGLGAAVALLRQLDPAALWAHLQAWHDLLEPQLLELGFTSLRHGDPQQRSGILAVQAPADVAVVALQKALAERGVLTSIPDGNLRFSPHWPSPLGETAAVAEALRAALAELRNRAGVEEPTAAMAGRSEVAPAGDQADLPQ